MFHTRASSTRYIVRTVGFVCVFGGPFKMSIRHRGVVSVVKRCVLLEQLLSAKCVLYNEWLVFRGSVGYFPVRAQYVGRFVAVTD